ncbi:MAG: YggS family pyridoxal phosphate-dependent enzyme [Propionibacteriaceae bacterium]|jgi:pyridoxal phosphate enzyme (YggS family)|nr:YggS family pyridoxal phosphate-dependent enzyme [Propionibacteriaceae bacterium]
MNPIAANLTAIKSRIAAACAQAGRRADEVTLLPVSKTRTVAEILRARSFGLSRFGENRAQEALAKAQELAQTDIEWVIIGHLQTNKAKIAAQIASEYQALDSLELAASLDRRLQAAGKQLDVLIQVNSSAEPQKFGLAPEAVLGFAAALAPFDALRVRGLMTIAVNSPEREQVAQCFQLMRRLQADLRDHAVPGQSYDELSMGMSGDFELAIAHGATQVRIGEAIFGPRGESGDEDQGDVLAAEAE